MMPTTRASSSHTGRPLTLFRTIRRAGSFDRRVWRRRDDIRGHQINYPHTVQTSAVVVAPFLAG